MHLILPVVFILEVSAQLPVTQYAFHHRHGAQTTFIGRGNRALNSSDWNNTVTAFMKARDIPGLSLAVTYDDRLVFASGFGHADISALQPVSTSDRFRLASVSKVLTAIAAMYLVQEGKMSLDDKVFGPGAILGCRYGHSPYSHFERNITVQHLLEHTSGFVNEDMCGNDCDPTYLPELLDLDQWQLVGAIRDRFRQSHLPGMVASYSNFGYFILGRVVEAVSGTFPYESFVRGQILARFNVTDMRVGTDKRQKNEVVYYDDSDPQMPYSFHVKRRDSVGAFIATAIDLVKLTASVVGFTGRHNFLNTTSQDLMFKQSSVEGSNYAKGWDVYSDSEGKLARAEKYGDYSGTNAFLKIDFARKISYAIIINKEIPDNETFHGGRDLRDLMDGMLSDVTEWPKWDLFNSNELDQPTGT